MGNEKNIVPGGGLLPQIRKENIGDIVKRLEVEWETLQLFQDAKKELANLYYWEAQLKVEDRETLKKATELGNLAAKFEGDIADAINTVKKKTHQLDKGIGNYRNFKTNPFRGLKKVFADRIAAYREILEEERREKIRLAEKAAREAEEAEGQNRLDEAADLEQKGHTDEAKEVFEGIEDIHVGMIMPEGVENTTHTESGKAIGREDVEIEITDTGVLIKEIAAGRAPIGCVKILEGTLKKYIKAMGITKMPGVYIRRKKSTAFQGK